MRLPTASKPVLNAMRVRGKAGDSRTGPQAALLFVLEPSRS
jgi:hypothetical protein